MSERDSNTLTGPVFDDTTEITIIELCRICTVSSDTVDAMIAEGILEPSSSRTDERRFTYAGVRRTRTALHLQRDLGLNLAGVALALDLLDRIEELRGQLRRR